MEKTIRCDISVLFPLFVLVTVKNIGLLKIINNTLFDRGFFSHFVIVNSGKRKLKTNLRLERSCLASHKLFSNLRLQQLYWEWLFLLAHINHQSLHEHLLWLLTLFEELCLSLRACWLPVGVFDSGSLVDRETTLT